MSETIEHVTEDEWRLRKHRGWQRPAEGASGYVTRERETMAWELLEDQDGAPYPDEVQRACLQRLIQELAQLEEDLRQSGNSWAANVLSRRIRALSTGV